MSRRLLIGLCSALLIITWPTVASPAGAAAESAAALTTAAELGPLTAARPAKVTVPSNYIFNPKLGVLHDYCTLAPDEFPAPHAVNADFRGPCARHDLCYAGSASEKSCDKALRRNMFRNCEHYYGRYNPLRTGCKAASLTYWAAVAAV